MPTPRARLVLSALVVMPLTLDGHFRLLEPASWLVENHRGDPQNAAPCGVDAKNVGTASYAGTRATGGSTLRLRVQETAYHPGHYRVALAVNSRDELPPDPDAMARDTEKGPYSVWAVVQSPPQIPVLADGLFPHYTPPGAPQTFEADIPLPNINCRKCTLQVIQWMADHPLNDPGGFAHHHCADLEIVADPSKPIDKRWPGPR